MEGHPNVSRNIQEIADMPGISLFDVEPGAVVDLDLSFDEDGGRRGQIRLRVDEPASREGWKRGKFTVIGAELSFESTIGELVGKTGSIDSSIDFKPGLGPPLRMAQVARIVRGRDLIMNFDIPETPDMVHRWIPFVLDCSLSAPEQ